MTIKDIARLSGCGVATVSRVLNDHPDVSDETRRKVLAVVEAQGFQPNNNAKHLKQQAGTGITILVKGTQNWWNGSRPSSGTAGGTPWSTTWTRTPTR